MRDRGGAEYVPVWERVSEEGDTSSADREIGHVRPIALLSPSRQADKALGLSGRQLRKLRKRLRRPLL